MTSNPQAEGFSLPTRDTYDYVVDRSDRIESVSEAWLRFAEVNGAPELTREAVIGNSLWAFVRSSDTQSFYRALFHRVRFKKIEVNLPFRCDSPDLLRFMVLHVRLGSKGRLKLSGRLLREAKRAHVPRINEFLGDSEQRFVMCSICKRVNAFGAWVEPEVAAQRFHVFETIHEAEIQHGVCDQCRALVGS